MGAIAALLGNNVCTTREKLKSVFEISKKEYAQFFDCQTVFAPKVSFAFFWNSPALGCHQGGQYIDEEHFGSFDTHIVNSKRNVFLRMHIIFKTGEKIRPPKSKSYFSSKF